MARERDYRDVLASLEKLRPEDPEGNGHVFGERFHRAWQLVKEERVKRYVFKPSERVQWVVVGKEREYLIYPAVAYCQCADSWFAVRDGEAQACAHLIAQRIASKLGLFDVVEAEDQLFDTFMKEWRQTNGAGGEKPN